MCAKYIKRLGNEVFRSEGANYILIRRLIEDRLTKGVHYNLKKVDKAQTENEKNLSRQGS